jgi:hypothetical protein
VAAAVAERAEQRQREEQRQEQQVAAPAEALAHKADVKARAQEKVGEVKQKVSAKKDAFGKKASSATPPSAGSAASNVGSTVKSNPIPAAAASAFVGGFLLGRLTAR